MLAVHFHTGDIMGLFDRFKRAAPTNSLSTSRPFFTGKSATGVSVNERTAMQTAAVYACVRVISEAIASLPLHVHKYQGAGALIDNEHNLYDILHTVPNPEMTSFVFRETLMSHLLLGAMHMRRSSGTARAAYGRCTRCFPTKWTCGGMSPARYITPTTGTKMKHAHRIKAAG